MKWFYASGGLALLGVAIIAKLAWAVPLGPSAEVVLQGSAFAGFGLALLGSILSLLAYFQKEQRKLYGRLFWVPLIVAFVCWIGLTLYGAFVEGRQDAGSIYFKLAWSAGTSLFLATILAGAFAFLFKAWWVHRFGWRTNYWRSDSDSDGPQRLRPF